MLKLVSRARGRLFRNDLLAEAAAAACAALAAFILLLLLGAQVLNWRWLLAVPACVGAVGLYRALKRRPSLYTAAQVVDRRLGLADAVSTAFYYHRIAPSVGSPGARRFQMEQAERLGESVDLRRAIPYTLPRAVYPMAALFLVASSLFALRYVVSKRLDLNPALAQVLQWKLWNPLRTEQAADARREPRSPHSDEANELAAGSGLPNTARKQAFGNQGSNPAGSVEQRKAAAAGAGRGASAGRNGEQKDASQADSDSRDAADAQSGSESGQEGQGRPSRETARSQTGSGERAGLMDKLKDAVQNLVSRMSPENGEGQQQARDSQDAPRSGGRPQQSAARQNSSSSDQNGREPGGSSKDGADRAAADATKAPRNGSGRADSPQQGKQPGSGAGSEDGDKRLKQAEQLAAMGKISQILGRRAASIGGQATVEVQSSASQRLRTPYARRNAEHVETGADIDRDEVPMALQAYVQQYFEQIRKQKK